MTKRFPVWWNVKKVLRKIQYRCTHATHAPAVLIQVSNRRAGLQRATTWLPLGRTPGPPWPSLALHLNTIHPHPIQSSKCRPITCAPSQSLRRGSQTLQTQHLAPSGDGLEFGLFCSALRCEAWPVRVCVRASASSASVDGPSLAGQWWACVGCQRCASCPRRPSSPFTITVHHHRLQSTRAWRRPARIPVLAKLLSVHFFTHSLSAHLGRNRSLHVPAAPSRSSSLNTYLLPTYYLPTVILQRHVRRFLRPFHFHCVA